MILRRALLLVIGLLLVGLAFADLGTVATLTLLVIGAVPIIAGVLGERFTAQGFSTAYTTVATLLVNTVVLLLVMETVSALVINLSTPRTPTLNQIRAALPYYADATWGSTHWAEIERIPNEYAPFVVWQQAPFEGQTVTMRADGTRLTPGADCTGDAFTVYMFGGSTMWGMGAPDDGTIPAYVQAALSETRSEPVCVVNFGAPGYVSTQGVLRLMTELQQGRVPDVVIFYDGINDVLATIQNNGAGAHQNLSQVSDAFQPNTLGDALLASLRNSYTSQLVGRFAAGGQPAAVEPNWEQQADETTRAYLLNLALVERMAQEYDFAYGFFWQPVLPLTEKPLLPEEAQFAGGLGAWEDAYALTYAQVELAADAQDNLHYIAGAFDDVERFLWSDPYHIVPEGNAIIADIMLDRMRLN